MSFQGTQQKPKAYLYTLVFGVKKLRLVIVMMMLFFLLHPVVPAFAAEMSTDEEAVETAKEPVLDTTSKAKSEPEQEPEQETEPEPESVPEESTIDDGQVTVDESSTDELDIAQEQPSTAVEVADMSNTDDVPVTSDMQSSSQAIGTTQSTGAEKETSDVSAESVAGDVANPATAEISELPAPTTSVTANDGNAADLGDVQTENNTDAASTSSTTEAATENEAVTSTSSLTSASDVSPEDDEASSDIATSSTTAKDATSTTTVITADGQGASSGDDVIAAVDEPVSSPPETDERVTESASSDESDAADGEVAGVATSTDLELEVSTENVSNSVQSVAQGKYDFSAPECFEVEDGAYYCVRATESPVTDVTEDAVVLAAPDETGDAEIYFNDRGTLRPITANQYDDAAPHYDAASHSIVWHALINDRYQIFSYDVETKETEQLTTSRSNSMEPSRHGEHTVWQEWVDNNWEIMLHTDGVTEQLTQNALHDVSPDVQDGYVVWNSGHSGDERDVMVYEITTGTQAAINDTDGGQVMNPRFVLVYDTKFANGDSVTKGFDPKTGELIPLAAQPGDLPPEIPDADTTGETRALIQNKNPNSREDDMDATPNVLPHTSGADQAATSSPEEVASTTPVNVVTEEPVTAVDMATTSDEVLPLTDFDIIVEPAGGTTTNPATTTSVAATTTSA